MKKILILACLMLAACQSCHPIVGPFPQPAPQPEPPDPWGPSPDATADAAPAPSDAGPAVDWCPAACAKGMQLKCPWAQPTAKGASCLDVCENSAGSPVSMQPECVAHATTCPDADACGAIPNQ